MSSYKTCAVPMCKNTTIKTPNKLFISVPTCVKRRKLWIKLARRNLAASAYNCNIFFCEDHFDLPNDMENYMRYKIMGYIGHIRMKPNCIPSKFYCQPDRLKSKFTKTSEERSAVVKRVRKAIIDDILFEDSKKEAALTKAREAALAKAKEEEVNINELINDKAIQTQPETADAKVQVVIRPKFRSKATQTIHKNTSPKNINTTTIPSNTKYKKVKLYIHEEPENILSPHNSTLSLHSLEIDSTPSIDPLEFSILDSFDQKTQLEIKHEVDTENLNQLSLENTLSFIKRKPNFYLGLSEHNYFILDIIEKLTNISEAYILLCLKKIKLNTAFPELADQFGISESAVSKIFMQFVPVIANVFKEFIFKKDVVYNFPFELKHDDHTYSTIDTLEIEIEKPPNTVNQTLTWSENINTNTAKYLISSTPDGIINYISSGYGGKISDVALVQKCNYLEYLDPEVSIVVDGKFNNLKNLLKNKEQNLVSNVSCNIIKKQDVNIKDILNTGQHNERLKQCIRKFKMLEPHSVVSMKMIKYLDDCVVIACALINIQAGIIRN